MTTGIRTRYGREAPWGAVLIASAITIGAYAIYLAVTDPKAYYSFIREDGLVENGSTILWALAAIVTLWSLVVHRKLARNSSLAWHPWAYVVLALFFIACGGEEISWGQRFLNVKTPEVLRAINVQKETTVHNIYSISIFSNVFFLLAIGFFVVLPLLAERHARMKQCVNDYGIPVPSRLARRVFLISLAVWLFVGIRFGTLGFHPFSVFAERYYNQMDDEIFEFLAAYSYFAFGILDLVAAKTTAAQSHPLT